MKREQKSEFLSSRVRYIPINTIRPNPQQPRRRTLRRNLSDYIYSLSFKLVEMRKITHAYYLPFLF